MNSQEKAVKCFLVSSYFWGNEDQVTPVTHSERLRELIPAIEFHLIKQSGHLPHYEKPDQVNPFIRSFLAADG